MERGVRVYDESRCGISIRFDDVVRRGLSRIEEQEPAAPGSRRRQLDAAVLPVRIRRDQDVVIEGAARELHHQESRLRRPIGFERLHAVPHQHGLAVFEVAVEAARAQHCVPAAESDQTLEEPQQIRVFLRHAPVEPAQVVVLAVGVVVAALRAAAIRRPSGSSARPAPSSSVARSS